MDYEKELALRNRIQEANDLALNPLKAKYEKAIAALRDIANEDFRGPRPTGAIKAFNALKELGEGL